MIESINTLLITIIDSFIILGLSAIFIAYLGLPLILKIVKIINHNLCFINTRYAINFLSLQVIISCYNEADTIEQRINNIFEQNYPMNKLSILVISDGSTDNSEIIVNKIAKNNEAVSLFSTKINCGKNNAINLAYNSGEFKSDILCFTDADAEFGTGALTSAISNFSDPRVGLVGGKISYWLNSSSTNQAEGFFWRLENFLREAEGNLGVLVSCTGLLIMMRRELFQSLPPDANTDFAMPLLVLAQGFKSKFDKHALVRSLFPVSQTVVFRRRKRTIVRSLTTMARYRKNLSWQVRQILFWHKTVRFYAFPIQLMILISTGISLAIGQTFFMLILFVTQILFYLLAILGLVSEKLNLNIPFVHLPYQFTVQNAVAFSAVLSFLGGTRIDKWDPPR